MDRRNNYYVDHVIAQLPHSAETAFHFPLGSQLVQFYMVFSAFTHKPETHSADQWIAAARVIQRQHGPYVTVMY